MQPQRFKAPVERFRCCFFCVFFGHGLCSILNAMNKASPEMKNVPDFCSGDVPQSAACSAVELESRILCIRGQRVMLDVDLAGLYGVSTKRLNEQVKRNAARFPQDFRINVSREEWRELVANCDRFKRLKHSSVLPNAFTEHGAVMLANIPRSARAAEMSVSVVRAFIRFREVILRHRELSTRMDEMEQLLSTHDSSIRSLFSVIRKLMAPPPVKERKIGFLRGEEMVRR